jgi:two-component system, NarL family, response regulator YdfI
VTRVLIVAASAVTRAGLEAVLADQPDLEVVAAVAALNEIGTSVEALEPDAVLVDVEAPEHLPLDHRFGSYGSRDIALVLLADDADASLSAEALHSAAHAVLPRDASPDEIAAAIHAAAQGLIVLHPGSVRSLLPSLERVPVSRSAAPVETLTAREIEILGMLAEGSGNKQIAHQLGISEHTVKFHVGSIMGKLGAGSRTEAVTVGVRHGLIMV